MRGSVESILKKTEVQSDEIIIDLPDRSDTGGGAGSGAEFF